MKDLKDYRNKELRNYAVGNILIILMFSDGLRLIFDVYTKNTMASLSNQIIGRFSKVIPEFISAGVIFAIIYIYVFILDALISSEVKFKICYLHNYQPGYSIFTELKVNVKDGRFTKEMALEKYKEIYKRIGETADSEKRRQVENTEWYKIYRKHRNEAMISVVNRDYLLCRDLCSMSLCFVLIYFVICLASPLVFNLGVMMFIVAEYFVTKTATVSKGKRLVYNTIAIDLSTEEKSSEKKE